MVDRMVVSEVSWNIVPPDLDRQPFICNLDSSIHPVTASLADAGIHCKYQSSYYADFILVSRSCLDMRMVSLIRYSVQVKDEQYEQTVALVRACGCKIPLI
jgi:hypothetical protein